MTDELQTTPFDRSELMPCSGCGKGMMHAGAIHFYEVTARQCVVDLTSIRQQHGLETMFGNAAIAAAFAPSTAVAQRLPPTRRLYCAECALTEPQIVAMMAETD